MTPPDGMVRVPDGDDERARRARFEDGRWVGPWEVERCPHGRVYSYRWYLHRRDSDPARRPTREDFEGADVEYGRHGCRRCHPEDDDA